MKKIRILIVDDSDRFRELLKKALLASFPKVAIDEAANRDEALQKVEASVPDLIFMDIRLREENGLELTKVIKETHPNITVLVVTGYDMPEYRETASRYGVDRFLVKTFLNYAELEELVKSYLKA
jgi:DNA-binding NarL/FixJ family response regulator